MKKFFLSAAISLAFGYVVPSTGPSDWIVQRRVLSGTPGSPQGASSPPPVVIVYEYLVPHEANGVLVAVIGRKQDLPECLGSGPP